MTPSPVPPTNPDQRIVDYDSGYDYCAFWNNRDYEQWVEARVLRRLLPRLGRARWFADFGGGFGRNAVRYLEVADRALLVDYSVANLTRASQYLAPQIGAGRVHLVRADLGRLPLADSAVETAMVVRVLHHLTDVDRCLSEMSRTVEHRWLVDVPIKHHILGRLRGAVQGRYREVSGPQPIVTGSTEYPFSTYQLEQIRGRLRRAGFETRLLASVNNFRRWDQLLPQLAVRSLRPLVYSMELTTQRLGRGWWGPSQFLLAERREPRPARLLDPAGALTPELAGLARRLQCPACRGRLEWSPEAAVCPACQRSYPRTGAFWDFAA
jgi:ubiquinone/menaquinone biosynthesis C-methylase UbiE